MTVEIIDAGLRVLWTGHQGAFLAVTSDEVKFTRPGTANHMQYKAMISYLGLPRNSANCVLFPNDTIVF